MRLLRAIWKLLVGLKDALVLLLLLLFFGGLFAALSAVPNPSIPSGGALLVDLSGSLVEQPAQADPLAALAGSQTLLREYRLRDLVRGIDAAATDARVKAIVLDLDRFTGGGQATIAAAGAAIDRARARGKPVFAYATGYMDDGYQLAAHASEVWLDPFGAVMIAGPGGSQLFYKGLLDKIGVKANVYRVGRFKSAVEPFTRTEQSPEARAANQALADALWRNWQAQVVRARPKAQVVRYAAGPEAFIAASGGRMSEAARRAGLVDRIGDRIAFGRRVAEVVGPGKDKQVGSFKSIALDSWTTANPERSKGSAIGVLTVAGTIVDGKAGPGTAGGDTIAPLLLDALEKNELKALVVRVDSPGGSVTGSERIRSAILQAKAKGLPIVISMGSVAASGGYWIATAGDRIFADPASVTGSIGVFGIVPTFEGALAKLGLSADGVKTTPLSGEPDLLQGTSPEFDRLLQASIEDMYRRFIGLVAQARDLPPARVDQIGQGRVWAGSAARQIGLVDGFGSLEDAIAEAARRAHIDPAAARPLFIEEPPSLLRQLLTDATRQGDAVPAADFFGRVGARPEQLMRRAVVDAQSILAGSAIQARCLECPAVALPAPARGVTIQHLLAKLGWQ
jgi:protease-4